MPELAPETLPPPATEWYRVYLRPKSGKNESNTVTVEKNIAEIICYNVTLGRVLDFTSKDGKRWVFTPGYIKVVNIGRDSTAGRGY